MVCGDSDDVGEAVVVVPAHRTSRTIRSSST